MTRYTVEALCSPACRAALPSFLDQGLLRLSVDDVPSLRSVGVLWLRNARGSVLRIRSEVVGLEERFEVDRLVLDLVAQEPPSSKRIEFPPELGEPARAELLWVNEDFPPRGVTAVVEAGIRFTGRHRNWMTVAGAETFSLAVTGLEGLSGLPKYNFSEYGPSAPSASAS